MAPVTIHCVRHAQGFHNISVANHAMHDPMLTPLGEEQCKALQAKFPFMDRVEAVVASPMKRTVYTALHSFAPVIKDKRLKVIALPELQETSDLPCDTGSNVQDLESEFRGQPVDWSYMYTPPAKAWNSKLGKWSATASAVDDRARVAREWLYSRPEKEIVVVTHGGFLHYLIEDWMDTNKNGTGWANTEYRSYTFGSNPKSGRPVFIETPQSRARRMGDEKPLSRSEQTNLQRVESKQRAEEEKAYQKASSIQAKSQLKRSERDLGGYGYGV
ncbi:putative phosphoglycerate mutase, partial [Aureobasidium melanogenum]